jgi:hypothetical protein
VARPPGKSPNNPAAGVALQCPPYVNDPKSVGSAP